MATSQGHWMLSLRFLVAAAACGKVLIAFVHKHGCRHRTPQSHSISVDGVQEEEDEQNETMLNNLRAGHQEFKNGMGANIAPSTSELEGAAQNAEDDFLAAILQHEFHEIKEKEGGERAIEVFMEKIATGGGCLGRDGGGNRGSGRARGGRETANEFAEGSQTMPGRAARAGSEDAWQYGGSCLCASFQS
ncbi:hypothetical protein THAOC_13823 [Thalassiosira oceanica]|uniref:Uncharacterized protein n=1 Tax=Thalassiosira oceanica TaxID=159749 RepID=K0T4M6_THAOC|nr:hypothetical protein THAOC_13823 [Thalassiosira oceanica]|eukprot:EJK65327.1 hypothetical protein THAOC_13823 [Thalassiosira oceanica]